MAGLKYSTYDVIKFIEEEKKKGLNHPSFYKKNYLNIVNAARRRFGSWKNAVKRAGGYYESSLKRRKWTENEMENIVKRRISLDRNVNARHMSIYYSSLYKAALRSEEYGSYEKLIEKCGKEYDCVKKNQKVSKDDIIFKILNAEAKNIDISPDGFAHYEPSVLEFVNNKFSDHYEFPFITDYDYALMCAGINPESVRRHRNWTPDLVLYELHEHMKEGHSSYWMQTHGNSDLVHAMMRNFKKVRNAFDTVKIYEEFGVFENCTDFRQMKKYKEALNGLRNVSMEGREKTKRDRSYIMNLGKHSKRMKNGEIEKKLEKIEKCLLEADELKKYEALRIASNFKGTFIDDATPTREIGCISGKELIAELEEKYNLKFFGPKTHISGTVFYYHTRNEERLKHKWALKNMK